MSTSEQENLESAEGDDLVAYLDGELTTEENRRIEDRLAGDSDYREQLRELDQAWEALDTLPRPSVGENFTRTTIAMVVGEAENDLAKRTADATQAGRSWRLRWAAVALVVTAASFTAASFLLPTKDARLLKDLPVIRQVDLLTQAGITDTEFLRELSLRVPVEQLTRDSKGVEKELAAIAQASNPALEKREQWVRKLSSEERQELWGEQDRFYEFTPKEQDRLRKVAGDIANAPDAAKLRETLVAYNEWLSNKRDDVKAQLRQKDATVAMRIAEVQDLIGFERRRLSDDERSKLRSQIRAIVDEQRDAFVKAYVSAGGTLEEKLRKTFEQSSPTMDLLILSWALNNEETSAKTRDRLITQLDSETQRLLANRGGGGGIARDQQLRGWSFEAMPVSQRRAEPG